MTVPSMHIRGVRVEMYNAAEQNRTRGKEFTFYHTVVEVPSEVNVELVALPTARQIGLLAQKFLKSEYSEPRRRKNNGLICLIKSGLPQEDRAAFLGALCTHIRVPIKRS